MNKGIISKLVFGGDGLIKPTDAPVVFIPFVAPSEKVSYEITEVKRSFTRGKLLQVIEPSADRVKARCSHFGVCGGCQLQHINYPKQAEVKRTFLQDAFRGLPFDIDQITLTQAKQPWAWRRKVTLQWNHRALCYHDLQGKELPVRECPIFADECDQLFATLQRELSFLKQARVEIQQWGKKNALFIQTDEKVENTILEKFTNALPTLFFIEIQEKAGTLKWGEEVVVETIANTPFYLSPKAFLQNHPEAIEMLYGEVLSTIKTGERIVDLYCGTGILTLLLGKKAKSVLGIDLNQAGIDMGKLNAKKQQLTHVRFSCRAVEAGLKEVLAHEKPTTVILNPPRVGAARSVIELLKTKGPESLIYISCMPPTLTRDLKELIQGGYTIRSVQGYDLFPQTTHVETIVHLQR